jgi:hypothetical protein
MEDRSKPAEPPVKEAPDCSYVYANNFFLRGSVWDFSILFGQLSRLGDEGIDWHTVVTMPMAAFKILSYYMAINIAVNDAQGEIKVPAKMVPPPPPAPFGEDANDPRNWATYDFGYDLYERYFRTGVPREIRPASLTSPSAPTPEGSGPSAGSPLPQA